MKLRIANKDDFATEIGTKKIGTLYFEQSVTGAIEHFPKYFTNDTDMTQFKILYASNQIYVPVAPFEEVPILEEEITN
jgi:hypothetical protein